MLGPLSAAESARAFEVSFTWSLSRPMNYMRLLGEAAPQDMADIELRLFVQSGRLMAGMSHSAHRPSLLRGARSPLRQELSAPSGQPFCSASLVRTFERRQPNGARHAIRHILLLCCPQGREPLSRACSNPAEPVSLFLQQLEVDLEAGTVDPIPCSTPAPFAALPSRDYFSPEPSGLPEKINGAPLRRDLLRLLYAMAAIDSPPLAKQAATELVAFCWQLVGKLPLPSSRWPLCWGESADDARDIARSLTPTLVYLQENNCFDSAELAAFINSPLFARLFGESFTHMPHEPVQEEPIEFIRKSD